MKSRKQRAAIGLDIGGTKIAGGVVLWPSGKIVHQKVIPTLPTRGGKAVLKDTLALAQQLKTWATFKGIAIDGLGAGVPELVDCDGNVTSDQTIKWRSTPVQRELSKIAPARVESDVRAAAIAEALFGAGKRHRIFIYVTVGTGISYCLVQDGHPFRGAKGNAIIFASMPLSTTCDHCGTDLRPVLEEFASGPAIAARYAQLRQSAMRKNSKSTACTAKDVFQSARRGDRVAIHVLTSAGKALGVNVAFLVNILDPQLIVVGGGLGLAGGVYWRAFRKACREHIYADNTRALPIVPAKLNICAGIVGAAAIVFLQSKELSRVLHS